MIRWMWCLLVAALSSNYALGSAIPQLKKIDYATAGGGFELRLGFDQPYDSRQATIELINNTVQVSLPKAAYGVGKSTQIVKDQKIKSVYTYQAETELIRSRIIYFPQYKSQDLSGRVKIEAKDNFVIVSVVDSAVAAPEKSGGAIPMIPPNDLDSDLARALEAADVESAPAANLPEKAGPLAAAEIVAREMAGSEEPVTAEMKSANLNLAEDKIPVLAAAKTGGEKAAESTNYWRMGMSLLIILVFAGALAMGTKYWTRNKVGVPDQTKIRVITQHHLGPKKTLAIIQVAGESILIGVTDQNISLIKTLALLDEEIPADTPASFAKELNRAGIGEDEVVDRSSIRKASSAARKPEDDEAVLGRIQSQIADRLKEMRSL